MTYTHTHEHEHDVPHPVKKSGGMGSIFSGFVIGGLIGAVTALLMAPQSGEETRMVIRDKGYELRERAKETLDDSKVLANQKLAEAQMLAGEKIKELGNRAEELSRTAQQRADEVTRTAQMKAEEMAHTMQERGDEMARRGQAMNEPEYTSATRSEPMEGYTPPATISGTEM